MKKIFLLSILIVGILFGKGYPNYDQTISKPVYTVYYNYKYKEPVKETYTVFHDKVNVLNIKKRPSFKSDKIIPKKYRSYSSDYTHSGYDRGHLAPDAAFDYNKTILKSCYLMENITPQIPELNRKVWRYLENKVRNISANNSDVNVTVLVIYKKFPKRIGKHKIAVPSKFIKKIVYKKDNKLIKECYSFKNKKEFLKRKDLKFYKVNCEFVNFIN